MGAKAGLMPTDTNVTEYLAACAPNDEHTCIASDPDACYCQVLEFHAGDLVPRIACPHEVDNVTELANVEGTVIHQAYLGSCTGGRYNDLASAAAILKTTTKKRHAIAGFSGLATYVVARQ